MPSLYLYNSTEHPDIVAEDMDAEKVFEYIRAWKPTRAGILRMNGGGDLIVEMVYTESSTKRCSERTLRRRIEKALATENGRT